MSGPQTTNYQPQMVHASYLIADSALAGTADEMIAQIKDRLARMIADKVADAIIEAQGGMIVTPMTYTINTDAEMGHTRIDGTLNIHQLPDPVDQLMELYGGRMHGRTIRVEANPPETYLIPWVAPVAYGYIDGPQGLTLEYKREPGTRLYRFVQEIPTT